jgi:hypothetical protein
LVQHGYVQQPPHYSPQPIPISNSVHIQQPSQQSNEDPIIKIIEYIPREKEFDNNFIYNSLVCYIYLILNAYILFISFINIPMILNISKDILKNK